MPQECFYSNYATVELVYPQAGWTPAVKKVFALASKVNYAALTYNVYSSANQIVSQVG